MMKTIFAALFTTLTVFGQMLQHSTMDIPPNCHDEIREQKIFGGSLHSTKPGARIWRWGKILKAVKRNNQNICYYYTFNQARKDMALYWLDYAHRKNCFSDGKGLLPLESIDLSKKNGVCADQYWKPVVHNLNFIKLQQALFDFSYKGQKESYSKSPGKEDRVQSRPPVTTSSNTRRKGISKQAFLPCPNPAQQSTPKVPQVVKMTVRALKGIPSPCQKNSSKPECLDRKSRPSPTLRDRCLNPYNTMCNDPKHTQKVEKVKDQFNSLLDTGSFPERDQFLNEFHQKCGKKRMAEEKKLLQNLGVSKDLIHLAYHSNKRQYSRTKNKGRAALDEHFREKDGLKKNANESLNKLQARFYYCDLRSTPLSRGKKNKFGCAEISRNEYPNEKEDCMNKFFERAIPMMEKALYTEAHKKKAERIFKRAKAKLLAYLNDRKIVPDEKARIKLLKQAEKIGLSFGAHEFREGLKQSARDISLAALYTAKINKTIDDTLNDLPELSAFACPTKKTGAKICLEGAILYDEATLEKVLFREFGHLVSSYVKQLPMSSWLPWFVPLKGAIEKQLKDAFGKLGGDIKNTPFQTNLHACFQNMATLRNQNKGHAIGSVADSVAAQLITKDLERLQTREKRWDYMRGRLALKCVNDQIFTKAKDVQMARKGHSDRLKNCQLEDSWEQIFCNFYNMPSDSINLIYHAQPKVIELLGCRQYNGQETNYGNYPPQTLWAIIMKNIWIFIFLPLFSISTWAITCQSYSELQVRNPHYNDHYLIEICREATQLVVKTVLNGKTLFSPISEFRLKQMQAIFANIISTSKQEESERNCRTHLKLRIDHAGKSETALFCRRSKYFLFEDFFQIFSSFHQSKSK